MAIPRFAEGLHVGSGTRRVSLKPITTEDYMNKLMSILAIFGLVCFGVYPAEAAKGAGDQYH